MASVASSAQGDASDLVLLATGADAAGLAPWAPELKALHPIKGQIVHFEGGPATGPVLRDRHGYVVPQAGGAIAGATMEAGRRDRSVDPSVVASLRPGPRPSSRPWLRSRRWDGRASGAPPPTACRWWAVPRAIPGCCWRWARAATAGCWPPWWRRWWWRWRPGGATHAAALDPARFD